MIRNYQKTSSDSNVDLSPIYNSLQTINALLYKLDVQTTIPGAINSISNSVVNIENRIDNITKDDYSLAYYITDPVLTKPLYQYNNYSTLQSTAPIEIFEPYVQSITRTSDLEGRFWFAYNLANCTLDFTNESLPPNATNEIGYEGLTCKQINADYFNGSSYNIGTYSLRGALLSRCSGQYLEASYCRLYDCDIHQIKVSATRSPATISNCFLNNVSITKVGLAYCLGILVTGESNTFNGCTLASYPTYANTYRIMNLNHVGDMKYCSFVSCELNCTKNSRSYSFDNCSFDNASIYHLTHTRFINCSGTVFLPKLINGTNVFDNNNNYIGELLTSNTYDSSSTYTNEVNTSWTYEQTDYPEYSSTYTVADPYTSESTSYRTIDTSYVYTFVLPDDPTNTINQTNWTTTYDTYSYETTDILTVTANQGTPEEFTHTMASIYDVTTTHIDDYTYETFSELTQISNWTETHTNTYTLNTTTEETLVSDYTSVSTYNPQLTINLLPEWKTPNAFTGNGISTQYINTYVNIDYYTKSMDRFEVNNCEGNVEMYLSSITTDYIIANNELYKLKLNINNLNSLFVCTANIVKDGEILIDSMNSGDVVFSQNRFDKLNLYYNLTQNQSIVGAQNEFNILNIQAGAMGNLRLSSCTINNGVMYGWNGLYSCTANYIENYGENSYSNNSINTLRAHNIKYMYDNTISKLIIEPNDYENLSFMGNSIGTIVCPSYYNISASAIYNTFGTIIAY